MALQSYKELIVWQKSVELSLKVYQVTTKFPRVEQYGITSQMRRAAVSIPSNIAEGYSRKNKIEYSRFINIAFGSAAELETQIIISKKFNFVKDSDFKEIDMLLKEILSMLYVLQEKLRN